MSQRCVTLYGPVGSGKTAVGTALAEMLGYEFVDTDKLIAQETGKSAAQVLDTEGEKGYRSREAEAIAALAGSESKVIATSPDSILDPQNRHILASLGQTIYLKASPRELYQRIKNDTSRHMIQNAEDPVTMIKALLAERSKFYEEADIIVDTEDLSVEEVTDHLIDELAKRTVGDI